MAAGSSSSSIKAKGKGKAPSVPASPSPAAVTATSTSTSISTTSKTGSSSDTVQEISSSTSASSCSCSEFPEIQVNKWSLHELKQGCDDALKQYLSQPAQFTPSHVHTDVRLLLGWSSSLIALGAAGWAWKVNSKFQETRGMLLAAVVAFALLQAAAGAYAKWVEGDTVFVGRRKVFAGRVSDPNDPNERPQVASEIAARRSRMRKGAGGPKVPSEDCG